MFYYLVEKSSKVIVGTSDRKLSKDELPKGYACIDSEKANILGKLFVDDQVVDTVAPLVTEEPATLTKEPLQFWDTALFKKARIKANKDPLLALQLTLALVAELRSDRNIFKGAIKSIEDILKKAGE